MTLAEPADGSAFAWFGTVLSLNLDEDTERWNRAVDRYEILGIETFVRRYSAVPTPENHHIGCALSWRGMVQLAHDEGRPRFLGLEDDAVFHRGIREYLPSATTLLDGLDWDLFFLGCVSPPPEPGETVLQSLHTATTTHALAINHSAYARILAEVPDQRDAIEAFLSDHAGIDQYFARKIRAGELRAYAAIPHLASQPALLNYDNADLAIAADLTI